MRTLTEAVDKTIRGYVSARRVVRLLTLGPEIVDPPTEAVRPDPAGTLTDPESGLTVHNGRLTAIAPATPEEGMAVADRLGRYRDSSVHLGGVPLEDLSRTTVRELILVADNDARLFTGPLRETLDPRGRAGDAQLAAALSVASARDVIEALPDGLASLVAERGREFSGGQQQRLRLARALLAGLAVPRLLGDLIERIAHGATRWTVDEIALAIGGFLLVQSGLVRFAAYAAARLGEQVLAELREDFVRRVLAIPLSTVERAGSGDLLTRTSRDVDALSHGVRRAVPETLIAIVTVFFSVGALVLVGPLLALPCLFAAPILVANTRWYLSRAPAGCGRENAPYSAITDGLAETVDGARTVEALGLARQREQRTDRDIARSYRAERYTLLLRSVCWPVTELAYVIPVVA